MFARPGIRLPKVGAMSASGRGAMGATEAAFKTTAVLFLRAFKPAAADAMIRDAMLRVHTVGNDLREGDQAESSLSKKIDDRARPISCIYLYCTGNRWGDMEDNPQKHSK